MWGFAFVRAIWNSRKDVVYNKVFIPENGRLLIELPTRSACCPTSFLWIDTGYSQPTVVTPTIFNQAGWRQPFRLKEAYSLLYALVSLFDSCTNFV
jgi:hypothetical protein